MKQIYSLLFLLIFISCNKASGQNNISDLQTLVAAGIDPYFVESHDTVSKYGPNCITRDVLQDRNGNYWFATWQGIIRYDGKVFTNYTLKENLIHFHVSSCYEDRMGNLWFGTARGGVYRYDGRSFRLFTTKDGLVDNNVSCEFEDKNGNMWFGTEKGVSSYDGKSFTNFKNQDGPDGKYVNCIMQDKTGKLWIGSSQGLYIFDGKNFTEFKSNEGLSLKVWSLFEDRAGNIWIGKFDGLARYDGKTSSGYLTNFLTYYIIEDGAGNIWLSHTETNTRHANLPSQVLYKYDASASLSIGSKIFTKIIVKDEENDFQIFGKFADNSGNIWFGTMHGPCRYDGKTFTYFTNESIE